MKVMKKVVAAALTVSVAATMLTTGAMTASAETSTGVGLAAHALTAYREGWQYVWGGTSYGTVDCSGLIYTYNYVGGNRVDMLGSSSSWGYVSDGVPRIHGLGLHTPGHVGVYIGSGMAVDARDEYWGVVYHNVYNASWVEWFKVAGVSYPENGWVLLDGDSFYYEDGQYVVSTSRTIDGVTYSFDSAGVSNIAPPSSAYQATDYSTASAAQAEISSGYSYNDDDEEEAENEDEYSEEEEESEEEESQEEEASEDEEQITEDEESEEEYSEEEDEESEEEESYEEESYEEESFEEESYEEESYEEEESIDEESFEEESIEEESVEEESIEEESIEEESVEEESIEEESIEEESIEEESVEEESIEEESVEEESIEEESVEESSETAAEESVEESSEESSEPEPVKEVKIVAEYGDQDYGDSNYVAKSQKRLFELGYTSNKPTGYFDEQTIYDVIYFQSMNDLEETGRVDEDTFKLLQSDKAVAAFLDLYFGDYDAAESGMISRLQQRLTELEYFCGDVTGYYGELTAKAVEQFCIDNGLDVTSNADVALLKKIFRMDAKHNPNAGCVVYGMDTEESGKMIRRLAQLRFLASVQGNEFDDTVLEAVHLFQKTAGFEQSEKMTPEMLELLYSENAPLSPDYNNLRVGYMGDDVTKLQEKLAVLKYYDGKNSGVYTAALEEAVKKFQKDNGLEQTGIADTVTIEKIATAVEDQAKKASEKAILKTATVADDALSNIAKSTVRKPAETSAEKKAETLSTESESAASSTNDQLPLIGFAGAFLALSAALIAVVSMKKKRSDDILR